MAMYRTPIVSNPRKDGSTMYTFSSALEDIGLNINERNNKVRLSHYVLLDIPTITFGEDKPNTFDVNKFFTGPSTDFNTFKELLKHEASETQENTSNGWFTVVMNNYMMNMETVMRNQGTYDHSVAKTVTERCFWKFLQKSGAIKFISQEDQDEAYYHENWVDQSAIESSVIKGFGQIASSSQSSNNYNINNETYIMVPSSYGQMKYLLKRVNDNNYLSEESYYGTTTTKHMEGHEDDSENKYPLALADAYSEDSGSIYYETKKTSNMIPDLEFVFSPSELKRTLFADDTNTSITYDNIAIDTDKVLASSYKFNAVLVYYSIYESNGNLTATNLFGIMLINGMETVEEQREFKFGELTKVQSTSGAFGSSYFFRLNIKTASIYDSANNTIIDFATAESSTLTDFNDVVSTLNSTLEILNQNVQVMANQYEVNRSIKEMVIQAISRINGLEQNLNNILMGVNEDKLVEVYPYVYKGLLQNGHTDHHLYIGVKENIDISANGIGLYYAKLSTVRPSHKKYRKRSWHSIPKLPYNNGNPEPLIVPILKSTIPSFSKNGINYYEITVSDCSTFCEFINKTYSEFETGYKNTRPNGTTIQINVGKLMEKGTNGICIIKDGIAISDFIRFKVIYSPEDGRATRTHYTLTF